MPFLTWGTNLSVGVRKFDDQHKVLIHLVNDLHLAMSEGKGKEVLGRTFNDLIEYTRTHFNSEEELMAYHNYPELEKHRKEHTLLTQKVIDLKKKFDQGEIGLTIPTMNFLKEWLTGHMLVCDRQYAVFFNDKNIY